MLKTSSKLPHIGTTIFTVMSALANEHQAINLSQGFPDFDVAPTLINLVNKYMEAGKNQYAPMPGAIELRTAISEKIERLYGNAYNPETEVTITAGATQAIYSCITALIKQEDEVIVFTPAYDCYEPTIALNGGKTIYFRMEAPSYEINWDEVRKLVNRKTRMIIINSPHNPTGSVLKEKDMKSLSNLVKGSDIIVLSDEVYEHIIFDGQKHESVCKFPELRNRALAVYSFGKTFHVTGWKVGYIVGPEELMNEVRKVHQFLVFSVNTPVQLALAEHLKESDNYSQISSMYQQKRDFFNSELKGSRFEIIPSAGTYFQLLNYGNIEGLPDDKMARKLIQEHGIASIPISGFYHTNFDQYQLRFCFAKNEETLLKATKILCKI